MKWFRYDSGFWTAMGRVFDWMLLNLLFLITSLPVVTLGASMAALTEVSLDFAQRKEHGVLRSYCRAWWKYWRRASGLWLLWLVAVFWLMVSLQICLAVGMVPLAAVEGALLLISLLAAPHLFVAAIRCSLNWGGTIKLVVYTALKQLPWSLLLLLIAVVPMLATILLPQILPYMILFWIFIGVGGIATFQGRVLNRLWLTLP